MCHPSRQQKALGDVQAGRKPQHSKPLSHLTHLLACSANFCRVPTRLMFCLYAFLVLGFASLRCIEAQHTPRVLIYSATAEGSFRHDSIPTAIQSLKDNQDSIDVAFDNTEDAARFTDSNLANYDAVVFLSTVGEGE